MVKSFISSKNAYAFYQPFLKHNLFISSKLCIRMHGRRKNFFSFEKSIRILKFLKFSPVFSKKNSLLINLQFDYSFKSFLPSSVVTVCPLTLRLFSSNSKLRLCRISFRKLASRGFVGGYSKSTW